MAKQKRAEGDLRPRYFIFRVINGRLVDAQTTTYFDYVRRTYHGRNLASSEKVHILLYSARTCCKSVVVPSTTG